MHAGGHRQTMALGLTEATQRPFGAVTHDVWKQLVALLQKYRRPRQRRLIPRAPMSAAWLREHAIESAKHRDPFSG